MDINPFLVNNYRHLTSFDVKAELLFDALLKNGALNDDIIIKNNGLFYRKYSKDILKVTTDINDPDILNIDLSRDGIYDVLPESITHNYRGNDEQDDPVQEYKKRRKEEKEARRFYNPLENELFRFRHEIEKYESGFFASISASGIADIIRTILGIEDNIPDALTVKLFYAFMKQKTGNSHDVPSICAILEKILLEKVTYTTHNIKLDHVYDVADDSHDMIMGINTTLESSQNIFLKAYHFSVGPLVNPDNLPFYFNGQVLDAFLNTFFNLFIPFHSQFSFTVNLNSEDEMFSMDDTIYKSRLGISTVL